MSPRVPPNFFAIAFGLAGLAEAWEAAVPVLRTPQAVPRALDILAAVVWLTMIALYLAQGPRVIRGDLRHPVLSPFVSVAPITGMLLAAALAPVAFTAARVLVVVFLAVTIVLGGWLTGQWMTGDIDPGAIHPGYFLPTVAGGLVGADCAALVHLRGLAEASFGIGVICWLLLGSAILNRLFTRPPCPLRSPPPWRSRRRRPRSPGWPGSPWPGQARSTGQAGP